MSETLTPWSVVKPLEEFNSTVFFWRSATFASATARVKALLMVDWMEEVMARNMFHSPGVHLEYKR